MKMTYRLFAKIMILLGSGAILMAMGFSVVSAWIINLYVFGTIIGCFAMEDRALLRADRELRRLQDGDGDDEQ